MGISVFPAPASGPTLAEITAAGNSAGWGATKGPLDITWTSLGFNTGNGVNTLTYTGLSSYKFLRLFIHNSYFTSGGILAVRFNSDTNSFYTGSLAGNSSGTSQNADSYRQTTAIRLTPLVANTISGVIDIFDANQTIPKKVQINSMWVDSSGNRFDQNNFAHYLGTSAISSLTILNWANSNSWGNSGIEGFYLYGGN